MTAIRNESRIREPSEPRQITSIGLAAGSLGFLGSCLLAIAMVRVLLAFMGARLPELVSLDTSYWQRYVAVAGLLSFLPVMTRVYLIAIRAWPLLLWLLLVLALSATSNFSVASMTQWRGMIGTVLTAVAFSLAYERSPTTCIRFFTATMLLFLVTSTYASIAHGAWMEISEKIRWIGLTAHPNSLGAASCLSVILGASLLFFDYELKWKCVGLLAIVFAFVCIRGADSVTSALASMVSLAGMAIFFVRRNRPQFQVSREVLILLALFVLGVGTGLFVMSNLEMRNAVFGALGRDASFTGREQLWSANMEFFWARPWFGWGFINDDTILQASMRAMYDPHSGYVHLLVGSGVMGAIGLLVPLLHAFRHALSRLQSNFVLGALAISFLGTFLFHNLTETSLARPFHGMWMMFCMLYFALLTSPPPRNGRESREEVNSLRAARQSRFSNLIT